jgi:citrate synthase
VARLLAVCEEAGCDGRYIAAMNTLEAALNRALGKQLVTNISAAIGAALAEAGMPSAMMRGVILVARCAGLVGHLLEENAAPDRRRSVERAPRHRSAMSPEVTVHV